MDLQAWTLTLGPDFVLQEVQVRVTPPSPWAEKHRVQQAFQGTLDVQGHPVVLTFGLDDRFPHSVPHLHVELPEPLAAQQFPHFEWDGNICFLIRQGMVTDDLRPEDILRDTVQLATEKVTQFITAPNTDDFLDEFSAYWSGGRPDMKGLSSFIRVDDRPREVIGWKKLEVRGLKHQISTQKLRDLKLHQQAICRIADRTKDVEAYTGSSCPKPRATALYLPLQPSPALLPPRYGRFWTPQEFRDVVRSHMDTPQLDALLQNRVLGADTVVLGIPRSLTETHRRLLVAVHIVGMKGPHLLLPGTPTSGIQLESLWVERKDRDLLMERGGANLSLAERRVLVLGCGSVGGHLATMLAQAGVGHLTLVDHDTLSTHNTYRHVLGHRGLHQKKVVALETHLSVLLPYLEVQAILEAFPEAFQEVRLKNFDLIINATGDPNTTLQLNKMHHSSQIALPTILHTWLEPLGIGGHVLVVDPGQPGCYRCLLDPLTFSNQGSFAGPDQDFLKDTVGCGSYYTPFADLDARRTAELAARRSIQVLQGHGAGNKLYSWTGDPSAFLQAGYTLTVRHNQSEPQMLLGVDVHDPRCPTCT